MEKKTRLRSPNYTSSENMLLCDLISKYKHKIENKNMDATNLQLKQQAWIDVAKEFNSLTTGYSRTPESLHQNYKNLKRRSKKNVIMSIPVDPNAFIESMEDYHGTSSSSESWNNVAESRGIATEAIRVYASPIKEEINVDENITNDVMVTGKRKAEDISKVTLTKQFKMLAKDKMKLKALQAELLEIQLTDEQEKLEHNRLLREMELEDAKKKYAHNEIIRKIELEKLNSS